MNKRVRLQYSLWLTAFFLMLLLVSCKSDSPTEPDSESILSAQIEAEMKKDKIPTIAATIIRNDSIVWSRAYGYSNPSRLATTETVYYLASISKTITATAVMQQVESGAIDLDKDINNYLPFELRNPKFPDSPITTRMLMTHRSGLAWPTDNEDPDFYRTYSTNASLSLHDWITSFLLPAGSDYEPRVWLNVEPGTTVQYSNIGGAILGYLVEAVTGRDFAEYCREMIFEPLEMLNSGFRLENVHESDLAILNAGNSTPEQYTVEFYPSTTARSSAEELSHFLIAYMNGGIYKGKRILQESTIEQILSLQVPGAGIGLIWWSHGGNWMGHTGGFVGVSSSMDLYRSEKLGVIILCNKGGVNSVYPGGQIYKLIHDEASSYL